MPNPSDNAAENNSLGKQSEQIPQDLGDVAGSIQGTLLDVWSDFIDHIPYFVGGLIILLLIFIVTAVIKRMGRRLMRRSRGEVVTKVKRALDEAGIEIPFPYRTLTFKEPLMVDNKTADNKQ